MSPEIGCFAGFFKRSKHHRDSRGTKRGEKSSEHSECSSTLNLCCDYSYAGDVESWSLGDPLPLYSPSNNSEVVNVVNSTVDGLGGELRDMSWDIHDHPEVGFQEKYAHDLLSTFMSQHGFEVTTHYLGLETAWRAEYTHGKNGRIVGINSEMDALSGIGHACGHNLIAISGCGAALALKAALVSTNTPGKIILLGTPAEEGGGGKVLLLERGAYEDMDICLMCHPSPGPTLTAGIGSSFSVQTVEVEYVGHSAHAAASPWEGVNALDAAFLAYSSISVLRQQMRPESRVHGIIGGKNWAPNVIPDNAVLSWIVRAPTNEEAADLMKRVMACFEAASLATGCKMTSKTGVPYFQLIQNNVLAEEFAEVLGTNYNMKTFFQQDTAASTDFGNVSFVLPSLHPSYAIPTEPNGGNHTPAFTRSARTQEAHDATMKITKGLALTGFRAIQDDVFFQNVKASFESNKPQAHVMASVK